MGKVFAQTSSLSLDSVEEPVPRQFRVHGRCRKLHFYHQADDLPQY